GMTRCPDGTMYFGYRYGTIYRRSGSGPLTAIAPNGELASAGFDLICDADNSLVLAGDESFVARLRGGTWTTERWIPNPSSVAMGSTNSAIIASATSVGRFNGTTWMRTPIPLPNGSPVLIPNAVWAS